MKIKAKQLLLVAISLGYFSGSGSAQLIHHWDFQEGSGTTAADLVGGNNGVINEATWGSDSVRDSYLIFDGTNDNVNPSLTLPAMNLTNNFTWAAWANSQQIATTGGQQNSIILGSRRDGSGLNTDFTPREFLKLTPRRLEWRPLDTAQEADYTDLPLNTWAHIAVVKEGATVRTYFNGTLDTTTTLVNPFTNLMPFFIGGEPGLVGAEHFNGFIDDVRLYNSALTQAEVQALLGGIATPPFWASDPIPFGSTEVGSEIVGNLNDFATNPLTGTMTFAKVSGPDWLAVGTDGVLSGTPLVADTGFTSFVVSATNPDGTTEVGFDVNVLDPNATIPNDSLFGWWPLNDGSGEVALDVSGNNRNASIINTTTGGLDGGNVWVADAECGNVLTFSGVDGAGAVATVNGLLPTFTLDPENEFTWSFWAKGTDDVNGADIIIGNRFDLTGADFSPRQFIKITGNQIQYDTNLVRRINYTPINTALGWAHHVFVKDGNELRYFRNSVLSGSVVLTEAPSQPLPLFFGGQGGRDIERWNGSLSDVRLFETALNGSEILSVMNDKGNFPDVTTPVLTIDQSGSNLVLAWNSQEGKVYNLRSELGLTTAPINWPVYGGHQEVVATPPTNTLTIPRPADATRFFVIEEFNPPPAVVFSDDFESGVGNWVVTTSNATTNWELGTPTVVGPPAANSGVNAFGTNISANYTDNSIVRLTSELIDLTSATQATLSFAHYIDADPNGAANPPFDTASVSILSAADELLATLTVLGSTISTDWTNISIALPGTALGSMVKLEFEFNSDNQVNGPGWYVDDVAITVP